MKRRASGMMWRAAPDSAARGMAPLPAGGKPRPSARHGEMKPPPRGRGEQMVPDARLKSRRPGGGAFLDMGLKLNQQGRKRRMVLIKSRYDQGAVLRARCFLKARLEALIL